MDYNFIDELPSNAKKVILGEMITSSTFWVTDPPEIKMSDKRKEFLVKEEIMNHYCNHQKWSEDFFPKEKEIVAVQHPKTQRWHRGMIVRICKMEGYYFYKVFMIDHGVHLNVKDKSVRELPDDLRHLPPLAYEIELYGILPTSVDIDYNTLKMKRIISGMWCPSAIRFVENLLKDSCSSFIVRKREAKTIKRIYVDLFLTLGDHGYVNLGEELCDKEYAVFEANVFEELVQSGLNDSSSGNESDSQLQELLYIGDIKSKSFNPNENLGNSDTVLNGSSRNEAEITSAKKKSALLGLMDLLQQTKNKKRLNRSNCVSAVNSDNNSSDTSLQTKINFNKIVPGASVDGDSVLESIKKPVTIDRTATNHKNNSRNDMSELSAVETSRTFTCLNDNVSGGFHQILQCDDSRVSGKSKRKSVKDPLSLLSFLEKQNEGKDVPEPSKKNVGYQSEPVQNPSFAVNYSEINLKENSASSVEQVEKEILKLNSSVDHFDANVNSDLCSEAVTNKLGATEYRNVLMDKPILTPSPTGGKERENGNQNDSVKRILFHQEINMNDDEVHSECKQVSNSEPRKDCSILVQQQDSITDNLKQKDAGAGACKNKGELSLIEFLIKNTKVKKTEEPVATQESDLGISNVGILPLCKSTNQAPEKSDQSNHPNKSVKNVEIYEPEQVSLPQPKFIGNGINFTKPTSITDRLVTNTVLVHGQNKNFRPISSIAEATFPKEIHEALYRFGIIDPMRIQTYAWPAILRGYSIVIVNPPKSGKTFCYIVPLMGFLFQKTLYNDLPQGSGPVSLILCSSSTTAQWIGNACTQLCGEKSQFRVIVTYGGGAEKEKMSDLTNGCDVLISTPRCLWRLMQMGPLVVNLNRLCHLVLDESDILMFRFLPELKLILSECKQMLKKRASKLATSLQIIACSEKWCSPISSFARYITFDPVICIGSYLEAVNYAQLKPVLHIIKKSIRTEKVKGILKNIFGLYKTVIVSENAQDVIDLSGELKPLYSRVLSAHENMPHFKTEEIYNSWNQMNVPGLLPVLICSDRTLFEFKLQDAMCLIHYDLPSESKSAFGFRFSCLMANYKDTFTGSESENEDCMVHILIMEENAKQLPAIVHLMKRLGATVSSELEAASAIILRKKDQEKSHLPLCYNIKAFGSCWDKSKCTGRHVIVPEVDAPADLPMNGWIKFKILYVHDAIHYSARILEHTDLNGNKNILPSEYLKMEIQLNSYYKDENNRLSHGTPNVSDICAINVSENVYKRVVTVAITKTDNLGQVLEVEVKFIDIGHREFCKASKLLHLPEFLRIIPPQAVDLFLCRLSPCDLDWNWSYSANVAVYNWLTEAADGEENEKFMTGKIVLSLSGCLWLDPIECHQRLQAAETTVVVLPLRRKILDHNLAVENPQHQSMLYALCKEVGLDLPDYSIETRTKPKTQVSNNVKPLWAFIPNEELISVSFFAADSPSQFFLRNAKWEERFQCLQKELQKIGSNKKITTLHPGCYCIAQFPNDDLWYRAQVLKKTEDKYELFFVDFGDRAVVSQEHITAIPEILINRLPFQALECELAGLMKISEETWMNDATDAFYDLMFMKESDDLKHVCAKVCEKKELEAVCTGGHKYKVVLIDKEDKENPVIINKRLIEMGVAVVKESEKSFLEDCLLANINETTKQDDGNEQGDEEIEEINLDTLINKPMKDILQIPSDVVPYKADKNDTVTPVFNFNDFDMDDEDFEDFMAALLKVKISTPKSFATSDSTDTVLSADEIDTAGNDASSEASSCSSLEKWKQNDGCSIEQSITPLVSKARTPQIYWHQNALNVWISIKLVGIEKYHLSWTKNELEFSTNKDAIYYVKLETFGCFHPGKVEHSAKGMSVEIKIEKLTKGYMWLRLLKSEDKKTWLKVDYDYEDSAVTYLEAIDEGAELLKAEGDVSWCKVLDSKKNHKDEEDFTATGKQILIDSDEDGNEDLESDDSVEAVNTEMHYNPYDPWVL